MKKIVTVIRPFDGKQKVYVYEDENKIDYAEAAVIELPVTLFQLAEMHDLAQVDLVGPKQYIKGLVKKIKEAEMTKYSENKLEINII